jgi:hypothetical protein
MMRLGLARTAVAHFILVFSLRAQCAHLFDSRRLSTRRLHDNTGFTFHSSSSKGLLSKYGYYPFSKSAKAGSKGRTSAPSMLPLTEQPCTTRRSRGRRRVSVYAAMDERSVFYPQLSPSLSTPTSLAPTSTSFHGLSEPHLSAAPQASRLHRTITFSVEYMHVTEHQPLMSDITEAAKVTVELMEQVISDAMSPYLRPSSTLVHGEAIAYSAGPVSVLFQIHFTTDDVEDLSANDIEALVKVSLSHPYDIKLVQRLQTLPNSNTFSTIDGVFYRPLPGGTVSVLDNGFWSPIFDQSATITDENQQTAWNELGVMELPYSKSVSFDLGSVNTMKSR